MDRFLMNEGAKTHSAINRNNGGNIESNKHKGEILWVDKYRPVKINGIIGQTDITTILSKIVETGKLPHLLVHGPPGVGKTSAILALANELYGRKNLCDRVMELNASDERGINIVRTKIMSFAKTMIGDPDPDYPSPPYKLIILDEADAMTTEAQSALRKVMESLCKITRFCFICNYIDKIIDPISSRCMKFRFGPIPHSALICKLMAISKRENLIISDTNMEIFVNIIKGDARKGVMSLQNLKYISGGDDLNISENIEITKEDIYIVTNHFDKTYIEPIWNLCFNKSTTINILINNVNKINAEGYPITVILDVILELCLKNTFLNEQQKGNVLLHLGSTERKLIDGANEYIQLLNIFTHVYAIYRNHTHVFDKNVNI